jgi:hypothetical protein
MAADTYYWRVRASGPLNSPWSETREFTVEQSTAFSLESPESGATGVSLTPALVWSEFDEAIGYEVMLSEDPDFTIIEFSRSTENTYFQIEEPLAYNTTYYWRARGVTGPPPPQQAAPGGPWMAGVFTTMAEPEEPTPPVTIVPTPPTEVQVITVEVPGPPQAIPSYLLWTIIGVGALLVIALIVLIVRTRRVV